MNTLETKSCNLNLANELDNNDPLSHFRKRFHFPKFKSNKSYIYFSGNSLGLQPDSAEKYIKEELEAWKLMGVDKIVFYLLSILSTIHLTTTS